MTDTGPQGSGWGQEARPPARFQVYPPAYTMPPLSVAKMISIASSLVFKSPQLSPASRFHGEARMNFLIKHKPHNSHHCSKAFSDRPLVSGDRPKPFHPRYIPNSGPGPGMLSLSSSSHLELTQIWSQLSSSTIRSQLRDLSKSPVPPHSPQPESVSLFCSPLDPQP